MTALDTILLASSDRNARRAIPIWFSTPDTLDDVLSPLDDGQQAWAKAQDFRAQSGRVVLLPAKNGKLAAVVFGLGNDDKPYDPFLPGSLARKLPPGTYDFANQIPNPRLATLAWLLEAYSFDRYKSDGDQPRRLVCPQGVDRARVLSQANAVYATRDLINMPANDMGPEELAGTFTETAKTYKARIRAVHDQNLLQRNFPMVHAVGRASTRPPKLIDLLWGPADGPKVTLVGKGVCFDTGGLDIKPASAMRLMKKDMGGAANVLGLARMIMDGELPVRLRVLVPAVENSISGNAFRPGDILKSRKGITVEIGNTDAEGRLVLADTLALADEEDPDLLISMATLTGAARVALGPELPAIFTDDDALAGALSACGEEENDPSWRLPLWPAYVSLLDSRVADINHVSDGPFAGAITAALFLKRFVENAGTFLHVDLYGWNAKSRPGHPMGGEAQVIRALFSLIAKRYHRE